MAQWYEALFENYGQQYDKECFVQGTLGECDFIERESGYHKDCKILDIGCGTGRHAIELTKRGYTVTGVDLSSSQLARARQKALEAHLVIDFQQQDARALPFQAEFDLAIMMCEGGFPLMETDEMILDSFDLMTFRDHSVTTVTDDLGQTKELQSNERYYVPSEITWLLKSLHFTTIDIFGAKLGKFSREHPLTTDDFEMLVIAEKG